MSSRSFEEQQSKKKGIIPIEDLANSNVQIKRTKSNSMPGKRCRTKSLSASIAKTAEPWSSTNVMLDYVDGTMIPNEDDTFSFLSQSTNTILSSPSFSCKSLYDDSFDQQHSLPIPQELKVETNGLPISSTELSCRSKYSKCSFDPPLFSPTLIEEFNQHQHKSKSDCEAAWKLRSTLRDDVRLIFQAKWQESEKEKSFRRKIVRILLKVFHFH